MKKYLLISFFIIILPMYVMAVPSVRVLGTGNKIIPTTSSSAVSTNVKNSVVAPSTNSVRIGSLKTSNIGVRSLDGNGVKQVNSNSFSNIRNSVLSTAKVSPNTYSQSSSSSDGACCSDHENRLDSIEADLNNYYTKDEVDNHPKFHTLPLQGSRPSGTAPEGYVYVWVEQ